MNVIVNGCSWCNAELPPRGKSAPPRVFCSPRCQKAHKRAEKAAPLDYSPAQLEAAEPVVGALDVQIRAP